MQTVSSSTIPPTLLENVRVGQQSKLTISPDFMGGAIFTINKTNGYVFQHVDTDGNLYFGLEGYHIRNMGETSHHIQLSDTSIVVASTEVGYPYGSASISRLHWNGDPYYEEVAVTIHQSAGYHELSHTTSICSDGAGGFYTTHGWERQNEELYGVRVWRTDENGALAWSSEDSVFLDYHDFWSRENQVVKV